MQSRRNHNRLAVSFHTRTTSAGTCTLSNADVVYDAQAEPYTSTGRFKRCCSVAEPISDFYNDLGSFLKFCQS